MHSPRLGAGRVIGRTRRSAPTYVYCSKMEEVGQAPASLHCLSLAAGLMGDHSAKRNNYIRRLGQTYRFAAFV